MSNLICIERNGSVLVATINRPEKKNALTGEMYEALNQALATASAEDGIGVVMIAGAGGVFSAGNDINDFAMRAMAGGEGRRRRARPSSARWRASRSRSSPQSTASRSA